MMQRRQLEDLYDAHSAGLYHYIFGIVHCESEAKDLLQELFLKLHQQGLPAGLHSERAWLTRIAHRLCIDWLRGQGARQRAESESAELPGRLFQTESDPDTAAFANSVESALNELPPEQRSIVQLKLWQGLTFDEIAQAQDISANTAASRYRYAIEKLRTLLSPLYQEI